MISSHSEQSKECDSIKLADNCEQWLWIAEFYAARHEERRSYAWKIILGFWAAIFETMYEGFTVPSIHFGFWALAFVFFLVFWVYGTWFRNQEDLDRQHFAESAAVDALNRGNFAKTTNPFLSRHSKWNPKLMFDFAKNWARLFQLGATAAIMWLAWGGPLPILDPRDASVTELAELYGMRWNNETDFSSFKVTLQMDVLRCKTPELVRKEVWTHALAYNLIRTVMAQSCCRAGLFPREISFKATVQILKAFQPYIARPNCRSRTDRLMLYEQIMDTIAVHQVGNRTGRFEPRLRKRRFKKYDYMMKPRNETKLEILQRLTK